MVFVSGLPARAQLPSLAPAVTPTNGSIRQEGLFTTARVKVDGLDTIKIASLANPPPGALPIDTRLLLIQGAVNQILAINPENGSTLFNPKTFGIDVRREGSQYVLSARDETHAQPVAILTVTTQDAQYAGMTDAELGELWRAQLQPILVAALERRQPGQIREALTRILRFAGIGLGISALLLLLGWSIRTRAPQVVVAIIWLLVIGWAAGVGLALLQFPQTVVSGRFILVTIVRVTAIWVGAWVLDRMLGLVIHSASVAYARRTSTTKDNERSLLRAPTMSRALNGFKSVVIWFAAALASLSAIQIPVASVVTIGGIAAVAIGFAAQSLVRDFLTGMLVLLEDQYVVGDYVMIGDYNGIVEKFTLRIVQIRDSRGNLISIPHSAVSQVVNASRSWVRVDYRVAVDAGADLAKSVGALKTAMEAVGSDEAWRDAVFEPVESIGVELLSKNAIVLRATMRCAPLRQFELRRVINERVFQEFARQEIALGVDPNDAKGISPTVSPNPA